MEPERENPAPDSPLGRAIAVLRRPVVLEGQPVERALAQLAQAHPVHRWQRPLLVGLALAAGLGLLIFNRGIREPADSPVGRPVRFAFRAPAEHVTVIGDFNDWDPTATPLTRHDGEWSATVPLKPGKDWKLQDLRVVVFVQEVTSGKINGAASAAAENSNGRNVQ